MDTLISRRSDLVLLPPLLLILKQLNLVGFISNCSLYSREVVVRIQESTAHARQFSSCTARGPFGASLCSLCDSTLLREGRCMTPLPEHCLVHLAFFCVVQFALRFKPGCEVANFISECSAWWHKHNIPSASSPDLRAGKSLLLKEASNNSPPLFFYFLLEEEVGEEETRCIRWCASSSSLPGGEDSVLPLIDGVEGGRPSPPPSGLPQSRHVQPQRSFPWDCPFMMRLQPCTTPQEECKVRSFTTQISP